MLMSGQQLMSDESVLVELAVEETRGIQIGSRSLTSRYFLAPLAGYTQLAFRRVLRELGGIGLATTDLVHARLLLEGKRQSLQLIETHPADQPLSVQLFGNDSETVAAAARWLEDRGYGGIDINMGCPMSKVHGQGGGAKLACQTTAACDLVGRVVEAVHVPVTVKMRLGWDREHITAPQLAADLEAVGTAAITVHGRTRQQGFGGTVNREGIRSVVEAVKSIPVIGNGDVRTVEDAIAMRQLTGCDAVAIGRGAMLDPWIFARIQRALDGQTSDWEPTVNEQLGFLRRHFALMHEQHGDRACVLFRKFVAWYGARLGIPEDLETRLRLFESCGEFDSICTQIEQRHGERKSDIATALVRVPNGPVELW